MNISSKALEDIDKPVTDSASVTIEGLKEVLAQVRICSRVEGLLLKKKALHSGDTPEIHAQKVDKLKVLSESLANSSSKAEKRILDTRSQREDALKFRGSKESEVSEIEKEIGSEIAGLEKQRDELEAELKRVYISLSAARKRLQLAKEEKDQFDEANNQLLEHLKTKEEELSRSIDSCKVEADVIKTWINFLEDTWSLQCTYTEVKEKQTTDELEKHEEFSVNLVTKLLSEYKKDLEPAIGNIRKYVENLKTLSARPDVSSEDAIISSPRRNLEEEYVDYEAKIVTTFGVVDQMKELMFSQQGIFARKEDSKIRQLFNDIEILRKEFESIERPTLDMENPDKEPDPPIEKHQEIAASASPTREVNDESKFQKVQQHEPTSAGKEEILDHEAELAKLESEFGKVGENYSPEDINDWEFDELEKILAFGEPENGK